MGEKKGRFKVWKIRKEKKEGKSVLYYLDKKLDEKCQSHLLFLKNHTLSTQM